MYPGRQVHTELPGVLVQAAAGLQPPLFIAHSSISTLSQFKGLIVVVVAAAAAVAVAVVVVVIIID